MRASLISREVIADSIELMVHAHDFDGLVCIVGCDKTVPAALMALARVDKPAVVLYSGPMRAGRLRGREVTIQDVWEAVGAEERGLIPRAELDELERVACPGPGTCAGHFTANTMAVALDCLGLACIGDGLIPADDVREGRGGRARGCARGPARADGVTAATVPRPACAAERDGGDRCDAAGRRTASSTCSRSHDEAGVALTLDELAELAGADAGDREPRAVRTLRGRGPASRRRHRCADQGARARRTHRRRRADGRGRNAREATADAAAARRRGALPRRRAVQADRRAARSAREPRARRQPREARRHDAPRPARACARLRQRGGLHRRRARRASRRQATCSSCATRARPAAPGCARC